MKATFNGTDLEECLKTASSELGIPLDKIDYEIIEEKKRTIQKKH